ncbi:Bifunctional hemolysin/adenylate cyclase precursor [Pseudobythopirellula maris]|uniref:Bifunctional hemolysin/adenylate cyclase n=2 Tax=Pseudobythopirellula maris TaxID=2527991 RepID=A0A5C5ZRV7_9BACT|nr:Bifunctional hemolysin/adenylate cyclase precursor [Pseudobythopirellula maris]
MLAADGVDGFRFAFFDPSAPPEERPELVFSADTEGELASDESLGFALTDTFAELFGVEINSANLAQIGATLSNPQTLAQALDNLDATDGNVVLTETDEGVEYDIRFEREFETGALVGFRGLGGRIDIESEVVFGATLEAHFVLGVDAAGFYLDAAAADAELTLSNLRVEGEIAGVGDFGFVQVDMTGATVAIDSQIGLSLDVVDPHADDPASDGRLRGLDFLGDFDHFSPRVEAGNPSTPDLRLEGEFAVTALPNGAHPFVLDATVSVEWQEVADFTQVDVQAVSADPPSQLLIELLDFGTENLTTLIQQAGERLEKSLDLEAMNVGIPLVDKSVADLLSADPEPVRFGGLGVSAISQVVSLGGFKTFDVTFPDVSVFRAGVQIGDAVSFLSDTGDLINGVVEAIGFASEGAALPVLTIRYDAALPNLPSLSAPRFDFHPRASLSGRVSASLGPLSDPEYVRENAGTLQELVVLLGQVFGVNLSDIDDVVEIDLVQDPNDADPLAKILRVTPKFLPDPLLIRTALDLGEAYAGLSLDASGELDVLLTPEVRLPLGILLNPASDDALADRLFVYDDTGEAAPQPEVTLRIDAALDNPFVSAKLGLLGATLQEDPAVAPNNGIGFSATLNVNVKEPTADDGRLSYADLGDAQLEASEIFAADLSGELDIDGLEITPQVGDVGLSLGRLSVYTTDSTDPDDPRDAAAFASAAELGELLGKLHVRQSADFDFDSLGDLTPGDIVTILTQLGSSLQQAAGELDVPDGLPFLDDAISEVASFVDVLQDFARQLYFNPRLVAAADMAAPGGVLADDAHFVLRVESGVPVAVTVPADATADNLTLADLVDDVNEALVAAGLEGVIVAERLAPFGSDAIDTVTVGALVSPGSPFRTYDAEFAEGTNLFDLGFKVGQAVGFLDEAGDEARGVVTQLTLRTLTVQYDETQHAAPEAGAGRALSLFDLADQNKLSLRTTNPEHGVSLSLSTVRVAAPEAGPAYGQLGEEFGFDLTVGGARHRIALAADATANNSRLADLAADLNAAAAARGIGDQVVFLVDGDRLAVAATDARVGSLLVEGGERLGFATDQTDGDNPADDLLGFGPSATAAARFRFDTIQDLVHTLNGLLQEQIDGQPFDAQLTFVDSPAKAIEFHLDLTALFTQTTELDFATALDLGFADLQLGGSAEATFRVEAGVGLGVGIDLESSATVALSDSTRLATLNGNDGVRLKVEAVADSPAPADGQLPAGLDLVIEVETFDPADPSGVELRSIPIQLPAAAFADGVDAIDLAYTIGDALLAYLADGGNGFGDLTITTDEFGGQISPIEMIASGGALRLVGNDPKLSRLRVLGGSEIGFAEGQSSDRPDLTIDLPDGSRFDVALDGAGTLGDVRAAIESATGGLVTVEYFGPSIRLVSHVDRSAYLPGGVLRVSAFTDARGPSAAAAGLGLAAEARGETFRLQLDVGDGPRVTEPIRADATADEVLQALNAAFTLPVVASVAGDAGGPYTVEFRPELRNVDPLIGKTDLDLSVAVATTTQGDASTAEVQTVTLSLSDDAGPVDHREAWRTITGDPLSGDSLLDRVYLIADQSEAFANATIEADSVSLAASLGILDVGLSGGEIGFGVLAGLGFQDLGDNKIRLSDLRSFGVGGVVDTTFDYFGSATLPVDSSLLAILPPADQPEDPPALNVLLTKAEGTQRPELEIDAADFEQLFGKFQNLSARDIAVMLQQVVELLRSGDIEALNTPLPLINQTPNDILDVTDGVLAVADSLLAGPDLDVLRELRDQMAGAISLADGDPAQLEKVIAAFGRFRSAIEPDHNFTLTVDGQQTAPIPLDSPATDVHAALAEISTDVLSVTGRRGGPYTITFTESIGDVDAVRGSSATGLSVRTEVETEGVVNTESEVQVVRFETAGRLSSALVAMRQAVEGLNNGPIMDRLADLVDEAEMQSASAANLDRLLKFYLQQALGLTQEEFDGLFELSFGFVDADAMQDGFQPAGVLRLGATKHLEATADFDFGLPDLGPITVDSGAQIGVVLGGRIDLDVGFNFSTGTPYLLDSTRFEVFASSDSSIGVEAALGGVTAGLSGKLELRQTVREEAPASPGAPLDEFTLTHEPVGANFVIATSGGVRLAQGEEGDPEADYYLDSEDPSVLVFNAPQTAPVVVTYPTEAFVEDSPFLLPEDVSDDAATFTVGLNPALVPSDGNTIGGIPLGDLQGNLGSAIEVETSGMAYAALDAELLGIEHENAISVAVDLASGVTQYELAGLDDLLGGLTDISNINLGQIVKGLRTLLGNLRSGLEGDLLESLPLVEGAQLGATFVGQLEGAVDRIDALLEAGSGSLSAAQASIQQILFDALGPGGAGILQLDPLFHNDPEVGDGSETADFRDVEFVISDPFTTPADELQVAINLPLAGADTFDADFDVGLDAFVFEFETNGGVELTWDYDFSLGFGVSLQRGFFFQVNDNVEYGEDEENADFGLPTGGGAPEINLGAEIKLKEGTSLAASLFFLDVMAETNPLEDLNRDGVVNDGSAEEGHGPALDEIADGVDYNGDGLIDNPAVIEVDLNGDGRLSKGTGLRGDIFVDFDDPNDDGRLTLGEIASAGLDETFNAGVSTLATIDLALGADVSDSLPEITAGFTVDWNIGYTTRDGLVGGGAPVATIHDATLDLGSFFDNVAAPAFDFFTEYVEPLKPLLDFLGEEVPGVSEVAELAGEGPVTFLTLGVLFGGGDLAQAQKANRVLGLISSIYDTVETLRDTADESDGLEINFGSYTFGGVGNPLDLTSGDVSVGIDASKIAAGTGQSSPVTGLEDVFGQASSSGHSGSRSASASIRKMVRTPNSEGAGGLGVKIPLLTDPSNLFKLFTGETADILQLDLPRLELEVPVSARFGPLVPPIPIYATLGVVLDAFADLSLGFDTRGIAKTGNFLDGLYFGDLENITTGADTPEFGFGLEVTVGLSLDLEGASVSVEGGVTADVEFNWNDTDGDGKLYLDEIADLVDLHPFPTPDPAVPGLCVFDVHGSIGALLRLNYEVLILSGSVDIIDVELFTFEHVCVDPPPLELAHVSDGAGGFEAGTLVLHAGDLADDRDPGAFVADGAEKFTIDQVEPDAVIVTFQLDEETEVIKRYSGVERIYFDGGAGDDEITLLDSVTLPAVLRGGAGNDTLIGGAGDDLIDGGLGDDRLFGHRGDDTYVFANGWGADEIVEDDSADRNTADFGPTTAPITFSAQHTLAPLSVDPETGERTYSGAFATDGSNTVRGAYVSGFVGGTNLDTFELPFALAPGTPNDWRITGSNAGDAGGRFFFSGAERLVGHDGDDNFRFTGSALVSGEVDGAGGADTLDFSGYNASVAVQVDRDATRVAHRGDGGGFLYSQVEAFLGGASANDLLITHSAGESVHVTSDDAGFVGSAEAFSFSGVEDLAGNDGNDEFVFATGAVLSGQLTGSLGDGVFDNDTVDFSAAVAALDFSILTYGAGLVSDGRTLASFSEVESLVGGAADDLFVVSPYAGLLGQLDGGAGTEDRIDYAAWLLPVTVGLASQSATALGGIVGVEHVVGGRGADILAGDDADNELVGGFGDDTLEGLGGDDLLIGGMGDDELSGGDGDDLLWGGDALLPAASFDRSTPGAFTLPPGYLQAEAAYPTGYFPAVLVTPAAVGGQSLAGFSRGGRDTLLGDDGNDLLFGGFDNDILDGGAGADYVDGGQGADTATGGNDDDVVRGGLGDDSLRGGGGVDQILGEAGADTLLGDGDATHRAGQRLFGGDGRDTLYAYSHSAVAAPGLIGDQLFGGAGGDLLLGNLGDDLLVGEGGNDVLRGDYAAGPGYNVNPTAATAGGDDRLLGGGGEDQLSGGGGDDELWGGADSDLLDGQSGSDTQYGGGGIDLFVAPTATGHNVGVDVIDGHFGNSTVGDTADDNATDILVVGGTQNDDRILFAETIPAAPGGVGQLHIDYNGQAIRVDWRDATTGDFLLEQIQVAGLAGADTIGFAQANPIAGLDAGLPVGTRQLDLAPLAARSSDFVGVFDGGGDDDVLIGAEGRDRLDGGVGSDTAYGFAGDDRLWGDTGVANPGDHDTLFAGAGNDDLIGGAGTNALYAWSYDPRQGGSQFGVFVDPLGALFDDDGELDGSNPAEPPRVQESTGLNRMLGMARGDELYGGTGLDFLYGNGGADALYRADGTTLESLDGGLAGDAWKEYAKQTGQVWYLGGTNSNDRITVDFVTEPGLLSDHHLITRLTENDGFFSFAAQVRLDFAATDENGDPVWNAADTVFRAQQFIDAVKANDGAGDGADPSALAMAETQLVDGLLPPEGDFLAIIIDALGGSDEIQVGPTVQKTVWIDAGDGDDRVVIESGVAILTDRAESGVSADGLRGRNDSPGRAFPLATDPQAVVYQGLTIDSPTDADWFEIELPDAGGPLVIDAASVSTADGMSLELYEVVGDGEPTLLPLTGSGTEALELAGWTAGNRYLLRVVNDAGLPTVYDLRLALGAGAERLVDMALRDDPVRRDVILGGRGDDILSGGAGEDWIFGGPGQDVLTGGLDRQASDLLFGGEGDDTFQIIPDALPELGSQTNTLFQAGSETYIPTYSDQLLGGAGDDRVLFLGGDLDRLGNEVPDYAALRYNTLLHRYEFTSLVWDIGAQDFRKTADETAYEQQHYFYQTRDVERTVVDLQRGDDTFHADSGFQFLPLSGAFDAELFASWGVDLGDAEQGATIAALDLRGGEGDDLLFGGALADRIDGGAGDDVIFGGLGDDELLGGGGADSLHGGAPTAADDAYPFVSQFTGVAGDAEAYAFELATPQFGESAEDNAAGFDLTAYRQTLLGGAASVEGAAAGERLSDVRRIGDFDGDGFDDYLLVGASRSFVMLRPPTLDDTHRITEVADIVIDHAALGAPATEFGDVNGDGRADMAFVRPGTDETLVTVVLGGADAWRREWGAEFLANDLTINNSLSLVVGADRLSPSGAAVALVDIDGDGFDDLVLSTGASAAAGVAQRLASEVDISLSHDTHVFGDFPEHAGTLYFSADSGSSAGYVLHKIDRHGRLQRVVSDDTDGFVRNPVGFQLVNGEPAFFGAFPHTSMGVFTLTDDNSIDIDNLGATASSSQPLQNALLAGNGHGLNFSSNPPRHSIDHDTMWLSDEADTTPTLTLDLGDEYALDGLRFYNYNDDADSTYFAGDATQHGVKRAIISIAGGDGVYTSIGEFEFSEASGTEFYTGQSFNSTALSANLPPGVELADLSARFVRFDVLENFAGEGPVGVSEVVFSGSPVTPRPQGPASGEAYPKLNALEYQRIEGSDVYSTSSDLIVGHLPGDSSAVARSVDGVARAARDLTRVEFQLPNGVDDEALYYVEDFGGGSRLRLLSDFDPDDPDSIGVNLPAGVSDPEDLTWAPATGLLYFTAENGSGDRHLYATAPANGDLFDFTDATALTVDFAPAPDPQNVFVSEAGQVFFAGLTNGGGRELWVLDAAGQFEAMFEIAPGGAGSSPADFIEFDGSVYFTVEHEGFVWRYDGVNAIRTRIVDGAGAAVDGLVPLAVFDDALYLYSPAEQSLWRFEGPRAYATIFSGESLAAGSEQTLAEVAPSSAGDDRTMDLRVTALGDVNGDGLADLAVADGGHDGVSAGDDYLRVLLGDVAASDVLIGTSAELALSGAAAEGRVTPLGDLDGDGYDDFALSGATGTRVYFGAADFSLAGAPRFTLSEAGLAISAGDYNGDGAADLAVADATAGAVHVFWSIGSASGVLALGSADVTLDAPAGAIALGPHGVDLNNDLVDDLIVAQPEAGTLGASPAQLGVVYAVYGGRANRFDVTALGTVSVSSSTSPADNLIDREQSSGWLSDGADAGDDTELVTWTAGETIRFGSVRLEPEATGGLGFRTVRLRVFDSSAPGAPVYESEAIELEGQRVDLDFEFPGSVFGDRLEIELEGHQDAGQGGFAELRVFSPPIAETLANVSVPGSGEFLANDGTGQPLRFPGGDQPYELSSDSPERWMRLTTLGDGRAGDALHVLTELGAPVAADLLGADGRELFSGVLDFDLRALPAGEYYLRVYGTGVITPGSPRGFEIEAFAPTRGWTHEGDLPDRDLLRGGDGDDTLAGDNDLDVLLGESGFDTFFGGDIEVRDREASELLNVEVASISTPVVLDPVVEIEDRRVAAAIAAALGLPVTTGHDGLPLTHDELRATVLATLNTLDATGLGLGSLEGVDRLVNLRDLDLSDGGVAATPPGFELTGPGLSESQFLSGQAEGVADRPNDIVVSPDGRHVLLFGRGGHDNPNAALHVYERNQFTGALTPSQTLQLIPASDGGVAVSADGRYVYAGAQHRLYVYSRDLLTGVLTEVSSMGAFGLTGTDRSIDNLTLNGNGDRLYVTSGDSLLRYDRDVTTGALSAPIDVRHELGITVEFASLVLSPDGERVYVADIHNPQVYVYDADLNPVEVYVLDPQAAAADDGVAQIAIDAEGLRLYAFSLIEGEARKLFVLGINAVNGTLSELQVVTPPAELDQPNTSASVAISTEGSHVYVSDSADLLVYNRDSLTGLLTPSLASYTTSDPVTLRGITVASSADGRHVYTATQGDTLHVLSREGVTDPLPDLLAPLAPRLGDGAEPLGLGRLERLDLSDTPAATSVAALAGVDTLRQLDLRGSSVPADSADLVNLVGLDELYMTVPGVDSALNYVVAEGASFVAAVAGADASHGWTVSTPSGVLSSTGDIGFVASQPGAYLVDHDLAGRFYVLVRNSAPTIDSSLDPIEVQVDEGQTLTADELIALAGVTAIDAGAPLQPTVVLTNAAGDKVDLGDRALDFDGVEDRVRVDGVPSVARVEGALTLSAWVNVQSIDSDGNGQERQPIIAKGASGEWEFALYVYDDLTAGIALWQTNSFSHVAARGGQLTIGQWSHVTGTYEEGGETRIYIDGVLVASTNSQIGSVGFGNEPLYLGGRSDGQFLDAVIDDAQIWGRAWDAVEAQQAADGAEPTDRTGLVGHWKLDEGAGSVAHDTSGNGYHGSLGGGVNGSQPVWTAPPVFLAEDEGEWTVTFTVDDGFGGVATETALLTVNNLAPTADLAGPTSGVAGQPLVISGAGSTDPGPLDSLSYEWVVEHDGAVFALGAGPELQFTPAAGGSYEVTLTVTDPAGATSSEQATVSVITPPFAGSDSFEALSGEVFVSAESLLANDSDSFVQQIVWDSVSQMGAAVDISPLSGALTYDPTASATLNALAPGETLTDTFSYTFTSLESGLMATGHVTVVVTGVNHAPVGVSDNATTNENTPITVDVLTNDTDANLGAQLTLTTLGGVFVPNLQLFADISNNGRSATLGDATVEIVEGGIAFDPGSRFDHLAPGESVDLEINYTMTDENGAGGAGTLTITIEGALSPPPLLGDYNGNGVVDGADFTVWRDALNTNVDPYTGADGDGDGFVGPDDYHVWVDHFGETLPEPEPGLPFAQAAAPGAGLLSEPSPAAPALASQESFATATTTPSTTTLLEPQSVAPQPFEAESVGDAPLNKGPAPVEPQAVGFAAAWTSAYKQITHHRSQETDQLPVETRHPDPIDQAYLLIALEGSAQMQARERDDTTIRDAHDEAFAEETPPDSVDTQEAGFRLST